MASSKSPFDAGGVVEGAAWDALCRSIADARARVLGPGVPDSERDRAEGFRYLLRFLASGIAVCVEAADTEHPEFMRMIDRGRSWGLDCPDCLYLQAGVRGDAAYRIFGCRGSANHFDLQVNFGHFALGDISKWGTIDSLNGLELEVEADGRFEVFLGGEARPRNWLRLAPDAEFVLVRQYFNDWERERPADLLIERLDAPASAPSLRADEIGARLERLLSWLEKGGALWEQMSRSMLELPPNTLNIMHTPASDERAGMRGQAYGMGNFRCPEGEAVIVEFAPPACRHWSISLATWYWEAIDFASRQSSLNGHQAELDSDGGFRGVIAHEDPGVPNWLDAAGHERGTLAARFLLADAAPTPVLRQLPLSELARALPDDTRRLAPSEREARLTARRRAALGRYRR
ncbi:MAG: hypothetical protein HRU00_01395 [Myxococcales bacterium]|nr:hypothetical protein [Myxococcales bacterium]